MNYKGKRMQDKIHYYNAVKTRRCFELLQKNRVQTSELNSMLKCGKDITKLLDEQKKYYKKAKKAYWWTGNSLTVGGLTRFALALVASLGAALGLVFSMGVMWPTSFVVLVGGIGLGGLTSFSAKGVARSFVEKYEKKMADINSILAIEEFRYSTLADSILERHDPNFLRGLETEMLAEETGIQVEEKNPFEEAEEYAQKQAHEQVIQQENNLNLDKIDDDIEK